MPGIVLHLDVKEFNLMKNKSVLITGILVFLCITGIFVWYYYSATIDVCNNIKSLPIDRVISITEDKGLHISLNKQEDSAIIHSPWTYGRAVCLIRIHNGLVVESEFNLMD